MTLALADQAAVAHQASWVQTHRRWGRGWLEIHSGFTASFSGLPVPSFNGASVYEDCDPVDLLHALEHVASSGLPYSLQCRPGVLDTVAEVAEELSMEAGTGAPLMVCTEVPEAPAIPGLSIRTLAPSESHLHAEIIAEAFGAPLEASIELTSEEVLFPANVWTLLGERDGRGLSTALVDLQAGVGNLHNVATLESERGRGYGGAITAAAVRLAADSGAEFTMLLSSPLAVGLYERLGFSEIEHWAAWESPLVI